MPTSTLAAWVPREGRLKNIQKRLSQIYDCQCLITFTMMFQTLWVVCIFASSAVNLSSLPTFKASFRQRSLG